LKFLVAMRPGFVAPTVAAKMSNTLDQLTKDRVLINIVTGGYPAELAADGDFLDHDERYDRTQEFTQAVRKAWTEDKRWGHEGKYYKVEGAKLFPPSISTAVSSLLLRWSLGSRQTRGCRGS
jgi:alkanesulfonate monooxygenase